jgi:large subunit ribosomal protein L15
MKYNELQLNTQRPRNRVGRGIAAGQGKTAGRGTKGQNARKSGGVRPGFEGGQNPLMQRLPKLRGFRSMTPKAENVYTGQLNELSGSVDNFSLFDAGLISSPYVKVKIVLNGELSKKVSVSVQAASAGAVEVIKKAGGEFKAVTLPQRQAKEAKEAKTSKKKTTKK